MNYALIENGVVINLIWLYEGNAQEFPNAVALGDRPVAIGDTYTDGRFYRDCVEVLEDNSLDDFELWMIKHLKSHSFLEKSVNEINNSITEYNNNGIIKIPYNFNEG